jgi:hypothetical protein
MNGRETTVKRFLCVVALGFSVGLTSAYGANMAESIQPMSRNWFGSTPKDGCTW